MNSIVTAPFWRSPTTWNGLPALVEPSSASTPASPAIASRAIISPTASPVPPTACRRSPATRNELATLIKPRSTCRGSHATWHELPALVERPTTCSRPDPRHCRCSAAASTLCLGLGRTAPCKVCLTPCLRCGGSFSLPPRLCLALCLCYGGSFSPPPRLPRLFRSGAAACLLCLGGGLRLLFSPPPRLPSLLRGGAVASLFCSRVGRCLLRLGCGRRFPLCLSCGRCPLRRDLGSTTTLGL